MSSNALIDSDLRRPPEEVLDHVLHYMQSEDIQLVEWSILLHRQINVPRIVSATCLVVYNSLSVPSEVFL